MTIMAGWRQAVVIARQALDSAAVDNRFALSFFLLSYLPGTSHHFDTLLSFSLSLLSSSLSLLSSTHSLLSFSLSHLSSSFPLSILSTFLTFSADESQFEKDLLDIARTTLSSKLLNVEKDHFARSVSECVSQSVSQLVSKSVCQSDSQTVNQSVIQSVILIHDMRAQTKQRPLILTILSSYTHTDLLSMLSFA